MFLVRYLTAICLCLWATFTHAAPIQAVFDLQIDDCVIFDTGVPYVFADDCTGTLTVETDSEITFETPDIDQTGNAILQINSPTYGTTSAQFFNFIEEYLTGADGELIPICLSYCFYSDVDEAGSLSFSWGAFRGLPYSYGQYSDGSGQFDYEDTFFSSNGPNYGMVAQGSIVARDLPAVPVPASAVFLMTALLGLWTARRA
jgi:hypothetical protein